MRSSIWRCEDLGVDPVRGDVADVERLGVLAHGAQRGAGGGEVGARGRGDVSRRGRVGPSRRAGSWTARQARGPARGRLGDGQMWTRERTQGRTPGRARARYCRPGCGCTHAVRAAGRRHKGQRWSVRRGSRHGSRPVSVRQRHSSRRRARSGDSSQRGWRREPISRRRPRAALGVPLRGAWRTRHPSVGDAYASGRTCRASRFRPQTDVSGPPEKHHGYMTTATFPPSHGRPTVHRRRPPPPPSAASATRCARSRSS